MSGSEVRAWAPAVPGIQEVFHARMVGHRYPPHTHDSWTVLMIDSGTVRYDLDGRSRMAGPGRLTVLPPHVVHDGRPGSPDGFRKRVLYLDGGLIPARAIGAAVDRPDLADPTLRHEVVRLHAALLGDDDRMECEELLALAVERLIHHLTGSPLAEETWEPMTAARLREILDSDLSRGITLAQAARALDRHPTHLIRSFTAAFGISPHTYRIGRRIDAARRLLLEGHPPAMVAASVGFTDQSHLTRLFKRYLATTPGRYAAGGSALSA